MFDQDIKRAKIEKSFKHIFSGDFAFVCIRGKSVWNVSTKFAIFDSFFRKHDFSSSLQAFLEGGNVHTHTFSGFSLLPPYAFMDHLENYHDNKYTSCELKCKFS